MDQYSSIFSPALSARPMIGSQYCSISSALYRRKRPWRRVFNMRIAWLDYARAFAAFAVLFYHYLTTSPGTDFGRIEDLAQYGYLGVPLFFMPSSPAAPSASTPPSCCA
jgi:hypothetical protein